MQTRIKTVADFNLTKPYITMTLMQIDKFVFIIIIIIIIIFIILFFYFFIFFWNHENRKQQVPGNEATEC